MIAMILELLIVIGMATLVVILGDYCLIKRRAKRLKRERKKFDKKV
jgi:hypothetical protein|tara:strand:- start:1471 stop:1608 length:138 start_codon:yes stop_codon:yes gene_type:complete